MYHLIIIYLLVGFFSLIAFGIVSHLLRKEQASDAFLVGALEFWILPIWPIAIPFMMISLLQKRPETNQTEDVSNTELDDFIGKLWLYCQRTEAIGTYSNWD